MENFIKEDEWLSFEDKILMMIIIDWWNLKLARQIL